MKHGTCKNFLSRMVQHGYVKVNADRFQVKPPNRVKVNPKLYGRFTIPFLSAPDSVDVFITDRCNLKCVHCFSSKEEAIHELSFKELKSIFNQLERLGVLEARINGGEPLLHTHIEEVLMDLKGRRFRKVILTNGTLLDEKTIYLLRESMVIPTVSLDGSKPEEHDLFRRSTGSFNRTLEALKRLQRYKMQYGINCCLHKENLTRINGIIDLAIKYGAYRIAFLDLKTSGRMKNNMQWMPSYDEYLKAKFNLMASRIRYSKKIYVSHETFLYCHPLKESIQEASKGYVSCKAGKTRLSIDSKGSVYPCNLVLSDPNWSMGSIKKEEIQDIWFSKKWGFFRGGVKTGNLDKCRNCKSLNNCRDFYCRLLPYITNGDSYGPHPKCS